MSAVPSDQDRSVAQYSYVTVRTRIKKRADSSSLFILQDGDSDNLYLSYRGYLKALDPVTRTVVLCYIKDEEVVETVFIFGHNIISVECECDEKNLIPPHIVKRTIEDQSKKLLVACPFFLNLDASSNLTEEDLKQRKDKIISCIKANRIPVALDRLDETIVIADSVKIKPPYAHDSNFICPTRLILKRIKAIVGDCCD